MKVISRGVAWSMGAMPSMVRSAGPWRSPSRRAASSPRVCFMQPLIAELAAHLIGDIHLGVHVKQAGIALVQNHIQLLLLGHCFDCAFQFLKERRQLLFLELLQLLFGVGAL